MREYDEIPNVSETYKDYGIKEPIGGAEYLSVPDDDIRWYVCAKGSHDPRYELPVVFFEILSKRLSVTDDIEKFLHNLTLPIAIRRFFTGNPDKLKLYVNDLLVAFPSIIARAGYLEDVRALNEDYVADLDKSDLKTVYSRSIQTASARDVPVIGAALSKLEGWDAPEQHQVMQVSEIRHIMAELDIPSGDGKFKPLPGDYLKKLD